MKTGEVDLAYLFGGPITAELRRSPGINVVAPLLYGMYWLDFLDQWDPKSPWAAARVEPFFTRGGIYAYGSLPETDDLYQRQAKELDRKQREAMLHQIQKLIADHVLVAPIFQQGFIWGVGPRVAESGAGLIEGFPYAAPCEDLKLT